jgi:hypothetical protein
VREVCLGDEKGDKIFDPAELETAASMSVENCCCSCWATLTEPTPLGQLTLFNGGKVPAIPIREYGKRLIEHMHLSPISIIAAHIYIY